MFSISATVYPRTSPLTSARAGTELVGVRRRVDVSLVEPDGIAPGDWVLIHVGFAMSKIREEDAREQLRMLDIMGETAAAMAPLVRPLAVAAWEFAREAGAR